MDAILEMRSYAAVRDGLSAHGDVISEESLGEAIFGMLSVELKCHMWHSMLQNGACLGGFLR
jgi:hypothetical protein